MKYKPGHKEATRRKIVDAAATLFRERGFGDAALPEIMQAAGLTVGGFYRHFESKDELFDAALEAAMDQTLELLHSHRSPLQGEPWVERAADVYLDPRHRANVAGGCPLPALTHEVARRDGAVQETFERTLSEIVDEVESRMPEDDSAAARERAWGFLATLVGGLLLARGVSDEVLAEEILGACRRAVVSGA